MVASAQGNGFAPEQVYHNPGSQADGICGVSDHLVGVGSTIPSCKSLVGKFAKQEGGGSGGGGGDA